MPKIINCAHCEKPFKIRPSRETLYCSRDCYTKNRLSHSTKGRKYSEYITKICPVCNKEFEVKKSYADRYIRCSLECRLVPRKPTPKKRITHTHKGTCARCHKEFTWTVTSACTNGKPYKTKKYCSEECYRPPVLRNCKNCSKEFRTVPANNGQFCNVSCYRKFCGETIPEKNTRETLEQLGITFIQEHKIKCYSIDFYLPDFQICLEIDGIYWHRTKQQRQRDKKKDGILNSLGYAVIRVSDLDINNTSDRHGLIISAINCITNVELNRLFPS